MHVVLRKALADAASWSMLVRNVAAAARPPKLTESTHRTWTADEVRTFLDAARERRLYPTYHLLLSTGMRRGEVLGLGWEHVDLEAARLEVRRALVLVDGKPSWSEPKTKRGRRSFALDADTVAILRAHKARQSQERLAVGPKYDDNGLVFAAVDGLVVNPDSVSQSFERLIVRARLPRIRLHDTRHTWATLALRAGVSPKIVSERLGHSSIAFTLQIYSHAVPGMQEDAAERVAALFR